jgi:hypothetical protein
MNTTVETKTAAVKIEAIDTVYVPAASREPALAQLKELMTGLSPNTAISNVAETGFNDKRILVVREFLDAQDDRLGAVAFEIPSIDEFMSTPEGRDYVAKSVLASVNRKYSTALLHFFKTGAKAAFNLPSTVLDFVTPSRNDTVDASERKRFLRHSWKAHGPELRKAIIAALAKKGDTVSFSLVEFEEFLANQQIAAIKIPQVAPAVWEKLIDKLIAFPPVSVEKDGKRSTDHGDLFKSWKANRTKVAETGAMLEMDDFLA